jgi:hypothetical protein
MYDLIKSPEQAIEIDILKKLRLWEVKSCLWSLGHQVVKSDLGTRSHGTVAFNSPCLEVGKLNVTKK